MQHTNLRRFGRALTPSLSSLTFGSVVGLLFIVGTYLAAAFSGSYESAQLAAINAGASSDNQFISLYQKAYDTVIISNSLGAIALFVVWGMIGMIAYAGVAGIVNGLKEIDDLKEESGFVHADKQSLYREEAEKFIIRVVALGLLFVAIRLFVTMFVPWAREVTVIAVFESVWLQKVLYLLVAFAGWLFSLHILTVLVRILLLRVRLFGEQVSTEDMQRF